jgi:hypothetical protein
VKQHLFSKFKEFQLSKLPDCNALLNLDLSTELSLELMAANNQMQCPVCGVYSPSLAGYKLHCSQHLEPS